MKNSTHGTKVKQAARAKARLAARVKRAGSTAPALRVTHDTLPRFKRDQKRRRIDPIDERYTAGLLSALKAARQGDEPKARKPLTAAPSDSQKHVRDRTKLRRAGMRYVETRPGVREWRYANGKNGTPITIGWGRVRQRRQIDHEKRDHERETAKLAKIGEGIFRAAAGLE